MTHPAPLSLEEFRHLVACYGTEPSRWPAPRREGALALLENSPDALRALEAERLLDHALDALRLPEPSSALRAQVATIPLRHPQRSARWRFWPFETWHPALAFAGAAAFGLLLGWGLPAPSDETAASATSTNVAAAANQSTTPFADGDEEWQLELDLAFGNILAETTDG